MSTLSTLLVVAAFLATAFGLCWAAVSAIWFLANRLRHSPTTKQAKFLRNSLIVAVVGFVLMIVGVLLFPTDQTDAESEAPVATPAATATPIPPVSSVLSLDDMATLIDSTMQEGFDNYTVTHDDSSIIIDLSVDGAASVAYLAQQGDEEAITAWEDIKDSFVSLCQSPRELLDQADYEDIAVTLNVLNDTNGDKVILSVADGEIVYDVTAEDSTVTDSAPEEISSVPIENINALAQAESYSEIMHMSKQGIYDQLVSEYGGQFSEEAAQYAIDNLDADFNANALSQAEQYSDTMHMSKQAIYDQLVSEYGDQFTAEEAQYAIDNLQADYKENALESAKSYQENMHMSREAIYDQLVSEYGEQFTSDEAQYAIDNLPE